MANLPPKRPRFNSRRDDQPGTSGDLGSFAESASSYQEDEDVEMVDDEEYEDMDQEPGGQEEVEMEQSQVEPTIHSEGDGNVVIHQGPGSEININLTYDLVIRADIIQNQQVEEALTKQVLANLQHAPYQPSLDLYKALQKSGAELRKVSEGSLRFIVCFGAIRILKRFWRAYKSGKLKEDIATCLITDDLKGSKLDVRICIEECAYKSGLDALVWKLQLPLRCLKTDRNDESRDEQPIEIMEKLIGKKQLTKFEKIFVGCYKVQYTGGHLLVSFDTVMGLNMFRHHIMEDRHGSRAYGNRNRLNLDDLEKSMLEVFKSENYDIRFLENIKDRLGKDLEKGLEYFRSEPMPCVECYELEGKSKRNFLNWYLWLYAKQGNTTRCQECLDLGGNVNCVFGPRKHTPLLEAVSNNSIETCKWLLQQKPDVHLKVQYDSESSKRAGDWQYGMWRPSGEYQEYRIGMYQVAPPMTHGATALMLAAANGNLEMCKLLLHHGSNVNDTNQNGETALFYAAYENHINVCEELLDSRSDVNIVNKDKRSVLFFTTSAVICDLLIKRDNMEVADAEDKFGLTPLLFALAANNIDVAKKLVSKSDVGKKYPDGTTMIELVLKQLDPDDSNGPRYSMESMYWLCEELSDIQKGANLEAVCKLNGHIYERKKMDDYTPLLYAIWQGNGKLVKMFLDNGANINATDAYGNTVFHIWAKKPVDTTIVQYLCEKSADIQARNKAGETVLHKLCSAVWSGYTTPLDLLEAYQDILPLKRMICAVDENGETALFHSIRYGGIEEVGEWLIRNGAKIDARNKENDTPLHIAVKPDTSNGDRCNWLIGHGANVHAKNKEGNTPLHVTYNRSMITLLLEGGASGLSVNKNMDTPLHTHIKRGGYDCKDNVDKLLDGNTFIFVDATNRDGNTPLHLAAQKRSDTICMRLLAAGANALISNKAGKQPLDLYGDQKPKELVELVKKQIKEELMLEGETNLDTVKVLLLGEPEAGKTTLTKALTGKEDEDPTYTPTAGIIIDQFSLEGAGNFSIWDCAGHNEFHVTHSLFLGGESTIYLVVYDLSVLTDNQKGKEYYEKLKYWLSFAKAGSGPREDAKPILLLVATHLDKVSTEKTGKEAAKNALQGLPKQFKESLNISECIVALNCREKDSEDMSDLKSHLRKCGNHIKENTIVPTLCEEIKTSMTSWCSPQYPVLTLDMFSQNMRKALHPRITEDWMGNAMKYLEYMGQTYTVQARNKKEKLVVVNLKWLCSKVIAQAFATEDAFAFMEPLEQKSSYTIEDFRKQFASLSDHIDDVVALLKELDLIFEVEDNRYIMPVKLNQSRKQELWQEDPSMTKYYGRRIECRDMTDIFSADVFPCFQVAMMKKYSRESEKPAISLNELKISQTVEGFVELIPDMRAIQYYVRGRGQEQQDKCHDMLKEIEAMIDYELDQRSPGTYTTKKYLSTTEIKKLKDLAKVRSYTQEQLQRAIQRDGVVHEEGTHNTDVVEDIVCKGYDMMFLKECGLNCKMEWGLTKQAKQRLAEALDTRRYTRDDYRSLAEACGIPENRLEQMEQHYTQGSSMTSAVLDEWCKGSHTVGELLRILCTPGGVDSADAKRILIGMIGQFGLDTQDPATTVTEGGVSSGISLELLAYRAALRRSSQTLCSNAQPDTLLDHLHHCFPEKTAEKLQQSVKTADVFTGMEEIITELLKLKKPTWWEGLLKGASHNATNLQASYEYVISEHEIFTQLRSQQN